VARVLRMPEVAANTTEAVLADWVVAERASFAARDTIATVETEKAVVDVEAESAGMLLTTLVGPGDHVAVGAPIAVIGELGEAVDDLDQTLADLGVDRHPVSGNGGPPVRSAPPSPDTAPAPHVAGGQADGAAGPGTPRATPDRRVFASPLARRLAAEAGLDIAAIEGTGPHGRVLKRDVRKATTSRDDERTTEPVGSGSPAPAAVPRTTEETDGAGRTAYVDVPHTSVRRLTAERLVASTRSAPHFYVRATLRAEPLLEARSELNAGADVAVSVTDVLVKAAASAHVAVPDMNVVWTEDAVRRFSGVDIAVAVATDRGLLTPVVRGVEHMGVRELARRTRDLVERSRAGRIRAEELEGGTLSVSNLGMFGTEEFAAIINPPQAAILAVGAVREEPVVSDGELAVGSVLRVTLSVDHRPVDGVVAARWMSAFRDFVEHPVRMLA
jgi:pyruvate dehydrogenase E2 component (dihydrolipoamide acetyltransferase)